MRLAYTIEVDVIRESGPNVRKADVSAFIVNKLIEVGCQWTDEHGAVQPGAWDYDADPSPTEFVVRDWTVYAHEGSEPTPHD